MSSLICWEEFERLAIDHIARLDLARENSINAAEFSPPVYRGQACCDWALASTLERRGESNFPISEYVHGIDTIKGRIETTTGNKWAISNEKFSFQNCQIDTGTLNYMIYLRHHGFPSPLLDWTASPYIAAYFAFSEVEPEKTESVSIFMLPCDDKNGPEWRAFWEGEEKIQTLNPALPSHKRHFLQQSIYSVCSKKGDKGEVFCGHESFVGDQQITKFTLPSNEKEKVLKRLALMGINEYSLYGTEDALMVDLARNLFDSYDFFRTPKGLKKLLKN